MKIKQITSDDIAVFGNPLIESRKIDDFLAEKINEIIEVVNKSHLRNFPDYPYPICSPKAFEKFKKGRNKTIKIKKSLNI